MGTDAPAGGGHRGNTVRYRTQFKTKVMGKNHFMKRNMKSGQFVAQKRDGKKFEKAN